MHFHSVFISDIHLGNRWCKAGNLHSFLSHVSCDNLFLLGDIFEGWNKGRSAKWNLRHHPLMRKVLKMARVSRIQYVTGNHDAFLDEFTGSDFDGVELLKESIYSAMDGRKLLLVHGDEYDIITRYRGWLAKLGHSAYQAGMTINSGIEKLISRRKEQNLVIANMFKHKVKDLVQKLSDFDNSIKTAARTRGVEGIICGHIHRPEIRLIGETSYYNCGDWLQNCSALVEHMDGTFEIIGWKKI
ncbi:MAG TPA: metallophosphoesterase family protein [Synergistales bacterium]|nr:metallophosphoesterase family protein [Synergistales bacterium]